MSYNNQENVCVHHRKMITMQSSLDDVTKRRMLQAKALSIEAKGGTCAPGLVSVYVRIPSHTSSICCDYLWN